MRFMAGVAALTAYPIQLKNYSGATDDVKRSRKLARILATEYDGLTNEHDIQEKVNYYVDKALVADFIIICEYIGLLYRGVEILKNKAKFFSPKLI